MIQSIMNITTNTIQAINNKNSQTASGNMGNDIEERHASSSRQLKFDDDIQPACQSPIPRSQPLSATGGPSGITSLPAALSQANYSGINNELGKWTVW